MQCITDLSKKHKEPISISFDSKEELSFEQIDQKHSISASTIQIKEQNINGLFEALIACHEHIEKCLAKKQTSFDNIQINIPLSDSFYLNIALIKAFKRLWLALLEGHQQMTYQMPMIVASTHNTTNDMFQQMISNTSQAISAIVEGVDAVIVNTENTQEPITAQRIGRNIHHILREESYLANIVDATSGAYLLEDISQQLITKTWQQFCTTYSS